MNVPQSDYLDGLMRECQELKAQLAEAQRKVMDYERTINQFIKASDEVNSHISKLEWQVVNLEKQLAALREALKVAHHELTQLHGIYVSDAGPDGLNMWQVDCKAALTKIEAALSATSSVTAKEPQ